MGSSCCKDNNVVALPVNSQQYNQNYQSNQENNINTIFCQHCGEEINRVDIHECDISRIFFDDIKYQSYSIKIKYKKILWQTQENDCCICLDCKNCISLICCNKKQFICKECLKNIEEKYEHLFICPICCYVTPICEICELE